MKSFNRLVLLAIALVSLSSVTSFAEEVGSPIEINVTLSEMKFTIEGVNEGSRLVLKAGQKYKISFANAGQTLHEVLIGRGHFMEDGEMGYREHMLENVEMDITGDSAKGFFEIEASGIKELELDPGMKLTIEVTIPDSARGEWEFGCFAEGHHQAGMHFPVSVE